ncbi:hypothetical protein AUC71_02240 [Methyloceanibacter marginalis]|uniref:Uncharacterized protein n=1 Tax=Methyloceanibacter marginalis TaxID=1774971 RepID=A0A1E3W8H1_9HYPH|nr:hypothetical protein AUC71_02240 [Methyloceanibacter marginalis]
MARRFTPDPIDAAAQRIDDLFGAPCPADIAGDVRPLRLPGLDDVANLDLARLAGLLLGLLLGRRLALGGNLRAEILGGEVWHARSQEEQRNRNKGESLCHGRLGCTL